MCREKVISWVDQIPKLSSSGSIVKNAGHGSFFAITASHLCHVHCYSNPSPSVIMVSIYFYKFLRYFSCVFPYTNTKIMYLFTIPSAIKCHSYLKIWNIIKTGIFYLKKLNFHFLSKSQPFQHMTMKCWLWISSSTSEY